ncbi:MAG: hypothetical protein AABX51_04350 [Nanoarchaeota archaeon]
MKKGINWKAIFTVFIGVIMVGSTIGFLVGPFGFGSGVSGTSIKVNGHKLDVVPGGFETKVGKAIIAFTYSPSAANRTIIPSEAIDKIKGAGFIYMASDPNSSSAQDIALTQFQLSEMLNNEFNVKSQVAFTKPFRQFPVVTCLNASPLVPVMIFEDANQTNATYENNCLVLQAENSAAYNELRDRLVYGLFGILT